jgi:beta-glucanase (GH16 family)
MEMSVFLPGDNQVPGLWPAFWAMGNLGRAGYMPSTKGLWPYSYDQCLFINKTDGSQTYFNSSQTIYYEQLCAENTCVPYIPVPGSEVPPQLFSACPKNQSDPNYVDRELYGMQWNTSRNAPEFDVFEIIVNSGSGASASQTLQMAPLLTLGQDWSNLSYYVDYDIEPPGVTYPGGPSFLNTQHNGWSGIFGRPGNGYQDSMSAVSLLNDSFYNGFHTFGVDWAPGEYLRWYVDGIFAYEINPTSLLPRSGVMGNQSKYFCMTCASISWSQRNHHLFFTKTRLTVCIIKLRCSLRHWSTHDSSRANVLDFQSGNV